MAFSLSYRTTDIASSPHILTLMCLLPPRSSDTTSRTVVNLMFVKSTSSGT